MKIHIGCIGQLKPAYRSLEADYLKRLQGRWRVQVHHFQEAKHGNIDQILTKEAKSLETLLETDALLIILDEHGIDLSSRDLATQLQQWELDRYKSLTCLIGGAYGVAPSLKQRAHHIFRLGRLTWPHQLARIMWLEQLYRSQCLITGHPYHHD